MTIKELIDELSKFDPNLRAFVNGYEGGMRDVSSPFVVERFRLNVNTDWYYGSHEMVHDDTDILDGEVVEKGIVIC